MSLCASRDPAVITTDQSWPSEKSAKALLRSKFSPLSFCFRAFRRFVSCSKFVGVSIRMVKVSFNSALGQKDVKKDAETLLPEEDKVSRKWLTELTRVSFLVSEKTQFI